jgi:hypothetical protein
MNWFDVDVSWALGSDLVVQAETRCPSTEFRKDTYVYAFCLRMSREDWLPTFKCIYKFQQRRDNRPNSRW